MSEWQHDWGGWICDPPPPLPLWRLPLHEVPWFGGGRQSGRTTKMVNAVGQCLNETDDRILVVAATAGTHQQIRRWIESGMKTDLRYRLRYASIGRLHSGRGRGFRGWLFADHTCWEAGKTEDQHTLMDLHKAVTMNL